MLFLNAICTEYEHEEEEEEMEEEEMEEEEGSSRGIFLSLFPWRIFSTPKCYPSARLIRAQAHTCTRHTIQERA